MSKVLVIIPAFNEEKNIFNMISQIQILYPEFDVLTIDDGSTDDTCAEVLRSKAMLIRHPFNMGYGVAIQTGYKFAHENSYEFLIQIDGDGQHEPRCIGNLYKELLNNQVDLVLGTRFYSSSKYKANFERKVGIKIFSLIVNKITKLKLNDVTTGFQAMNRKTIEFFTTDCFPFDYPDADIIVMANKKGLRIMETPVNMYQNNTGKSMHNNPMKNIVYVISMFIALFLLLIQKDEGKEK